MAERFPGDDAATNGFGRHSLQEWEAWLLFEANIPAPPGMRAGLTGWRLSNGGVHIPPVPDVDARLGIFAAEVDRVRSSLTDEQRALPQYAADNHEAWAEYLQCRQAQQLAFTNGAPMVGGIKNSDGCRVWCGVPGRTLHEVLAYLKGGNDPPLAYPAAAAPCPRRSAGHGRPGGSASPPVPPLSRHAAPPPTLPARRRCSASRPSPPRRRRSAGAPAAPASSSTRVVGAPPPRLLRATSSQRQSRGLLPSRWSRDSPS